MTARFEPIGLAELERRAALMRRVDRKYLLDREQLDELLERAPRDCRVLQIDGRTRFRYRSTYYDSPELASYRAAALGRRRRWKVRTRDYLDTGSSFLEVKTRATRQSDKHRIPAERLDERGRGFVREVLTEAGIEAAGAELLVPTLVTDYRRTTLLDPAGTTRLTIDTDLAWRAGELRLDRRQLVVVETKTAGAPTQLDQLLWRCGHRPQRISKYATGLAALAPDLPRTRWSRTLRRHFC